MKFLSGQISHLHFKLLTPEINKETLGNVNQVKIINGYLANNNLELMSPKSSRRTEGSNENSKGNLIAYIQHQNYHQHLRILSIWSSVFNQNSNIL